MSKRGTGKLAAFLERKDRLVTSLRTFCMEPSLQAFGDICAMESVRRGVDEFKVWRLACLYKYAGDWGLTCDPEAPRFDLDTIRAAFKLFEEGMCKAALTDPTRARALNIIHIFFATGEFKYVDLYYQVMGHELLKMDTKRYLVEMYKGVKEMYRSRVADLLSRDPEHFGRLGLSVGVLDFTYFDDVKERMVEAKKLGAEQRRMLESAGRTAQAETARP